MSSKAVLDLAEAGGSRLSVLRCASEICSDCYEKSMKQEIEMQRQALEAKAEAERKLKAKLKATFESLTPQSHQKRVADAERDLWDALQTAAAAQLGVNLPVGAAKALVDRVAQGSNVLPFGKYRDERVCSVWEKDKEYVRTHLAGLTDRREYDGNKPLPSNSVALDHVSSEVKSEALQLLEEKCLTCFCETGQTWKNWCSIHFREACEWRSG